MLSKKGKNISISEHLTKQRLDLLNKAKNVLPRGTKIWTSECTIFALINGEKRPIKSVYDLEPQHYHSGKLNSMSNNTASLNHSKPVDENHQSNDNIENKSE